MLSPLGYRLIADPDKLNKVSLRFFLKLCSDADLYRFKCLNVARLCERYSMTAQAVESSIAMLVAVGLLEEGPRGSLRGVKGPFASYRIRPAFLLSPDAMKDFFRETREREERESMIQQT